MTSASSSIAPSRLQPLFREGQQTVATYLPIRDICVLSRVCRTLFLSIRETLAREIACAHRDMTSYRSPAPVLHQNIQGLTLSRLDQEIHRLETRLRQIRQEPQAAAAAPRNPAEEVAIQKALNFHRLSRLPNDQMPQSVLDIFTGFLDNPRRTIRFTLPEYPSRAIDTNQWNALIGVAPIRPLPIGTEAGLHQPCSIFPGKTKSETHLCIDIPPTLNGAPLTLNRILQIAEHNSGNQIHVNIPWSRILQELGETPIPAGPYTLLKTCLPDTKNKTHDAQLQELAKHPEYMEATLMQVLVASLLEYIRSGEAKTRLFEGEYVRTDTVVGGYRIIFGRFGSDRPCVSGRGVADAHGYIGLAVVLRPGGSSLVLGPR